MLPFLTFASGIVAGVVGVQLLKTAKTTHGVGTLGAKARNGLDKAGEGVRDATLSGLSAIEKSSAALRAKLTPEDGAQAAATPVVEVPAVEAPVTEAAPEAGDGKPETRPRKSRAKVAPAEEPPAHAEADS